MTRRRLAFYLLLNAIVTVLVSWTVLFFYNRANPVGDCSTIPTTNGPDASAARVSVLSVSGTGILDSEMILIQNNGSVSIDLSGWTLKNNQGDTFNFPQVTIFSDAIVRVHSTKGTDQAADLYWQLTSPVWRSGELIGLYDPQNIARDFFRVP